MKRRVANFEPSRLFLTVIVLEPTGIAGIILIVGNVEYFIMFGKLCRVEIGIFPTDEASLTNEDIFRCSST